ncbi:MAG: hypothetical protein HW391_1693 [Chloroflexi bacterium]|nr:hypothetical protein [Chloroflexota bacterium]
MAKLVRGAVVVVGILIMLAGLATIVTAPEAGPTGLWNVAIGSLLVILPLVERHRYRSEAAEKSRQATGPGGGETADGAIETRFRPTAEAFVDPTTGHRMRVLVDPGTGERRYVAEG